MPKLNSLVKIQGPKIKGRRVLRPAAPGGRAKSLRFYNPDGEDFVAECPYSWARQLEASGDVDIVRDAPAPAPAPAPRKSHSDDKAVK